VIKWAPVDEDGNFLIEEFEKLITPRTKVVSLTHMSNALGTIVPIAEVAKICQAYRIPLVVDGSQGAVHLPVDVQALGCDFYAFTGHKTYGPTGSGILWGKREWLEKLPPYEGGGEMIATSARMRSSITTRRIASRPARRRSSRRWASAPRSTT
jgi:cysteine desulfurase/selenocysteine lyase